MIAVGKCLKNSI